MQHHVIARKSYFMRAEKYLDICWEQLSLAANDVKNPFHYPVVGTIQDSKLPIKMRTVILRQCIPGKRSLIFYTDYRSDKIISLQQKPHLSWLFYHPEKKLQIAVNGEASLHHQDQIALEHFKKLPQKNWKDYASETPPGSSLPSNPSLATSLALAKQKERAQENFCLVITQCFHLECLQLTKAQHERSRHQWLNGKWESSWLVP